MGTPENAGIVRYDAPAHDETNTIRSSGRRYCKACEYPRTRAWKERQKVAS